MWATGLGLEADIHEEYISASLLESNSTFDVWPINSTSIFC